MILVPTDCLTQDNAIKTTSADRHVLSAENSWTGGVASTCNFDRLCAMGAVCLLHTCPFRRGGGI